MKKVVREGISHVLLDIEGTTCPVTFVAEILFPYASANLAPYLKTHQEDVSVRALIQELEIFWQQDKDQQARDLFSSYRQSGERGAEGILAYLKLLIQSDRKVTPLKDLQGKIWAEGYAKGDLIGPIFDDVPPSLRHWQQQGAVLAVYSSGSITAQQLIYKYSNHGDLRPLFNHWFDTHTGSKHDPRSYTRIAELMGCEPAAILFVSDSHSELDAAGQGGLQIVCSNRERNAGEAPDPYSTIHNFQQINPRIRPEKPPGDQ
jgi:enolase-phosphatase E1